MSNGFPYASTASPYVFAALVILFLIKISPDAVQSAHPGPNNAGWERNKCQEHVLTSLWNISRCLGTCWKNQDPLPHFWMSWPPP